MYLLENPTEEKPVSLPAFAGGRSFSAVFAALIPAVVHTAIGWGAQRRVFFESFAADAEKIMDGQLYRCVTALLLHADGSHLLANMAGIVLFGTYASILYGWGVGWLLIVLCGAQGNFLTAWWYGRDHLAVGASTAVFAALGLCAAFAFWRRHRDRRQRLRSWMPLAAALALVGWLGTSPRSDLLAHLLGFASGLACGSLYAKATDRVAAAAWPYQAASLGITAALVAGSWLWGLQ